MRSWKKPTPEQVAKTLALLARVEHRRYFFDKLENPEWIISLRDKGFFRKPPEVIRDESAGILRVPPWPEAGYLARMAGKNPELVRDIIHDMADTANGRVHEDLAEAALRMPAEMSAQLINKAKTWALGWNDVQLSEKLGSLVTHLAKGGKSVEALVLARVLLEVLPGNGQGQTTPGEQFVESPRPTPRLHSWHYKEIIKKLLPDLAKVLGEETQNLFCDLLENAIRFSRSPSESDKSEDYSGIWRPRIDVERRSNNDDLKSILVSAVRDAFDLKVETGDLSVQEVVANLQGRKYLVFHRIALYFLYKYPEKATDLVAAHLMDKRLLDRHELGYEYAKLLETGYMFMDRDGQEAVLGMIGEGPDLSQYGAFTEGLKIQLHRWQRNHLALIRQHLPDEWLHRLEELVRQYGEPMKPEPPHQTTVTSWSGMTSPKSADELRMMPLAELVDFLNTWVPEKDFQTPSREGLGQILAEVVSSSSGTFLREADLFKSVSPVYISAIIRGLTAARKVEKIFDWVSALDLCHWIAQQPDVDEVALSLGSAKSDTISLICGGFEKDAFEVPFVLKDKVWEVLEPLTDNPDPTPEREAKYFEGRGDPISVAINSIRGTAIEAAIKYGLWVRRHLEELPDGKGRLSRGFDELPGIRSILDTHLNPEHEPSLAIRAIYGQWFPWLALLDRSWANRHSRAIFSQEEPLQALGDAAWVTYLVYCPAFDEVYDLLVYRYAAAVDQLGQGQKSGNKHGDPEEKLVEHLMVFYWRGKLGFGPPGNPFVVFWDKAPVALRGKALAFVGMSMYHTQEEIPTVFLQRIKTLWESRLSLAQGSAGSREYKLELASFGWWFISGKFEPEWALTQLEESLRTGRSMEADQMVAKKLVEYAASHPGQVIRCLTLLVKADLDDWGIYSWRDEAKQILVTITYSSDTVAIAAAEELIHDLGSRGFREFRDLLPKRLA